MRIEMYNKTMNFFRGGVFACWLRNMPFNAIRWLFVYSLRSTSYGLYMEQVFLISILFFFFWYPSSFFLSTLIYNLLIPRTKNIQFWFFFLFEYWNLTTDVQLLIIFSYIMHFHYLEKHTRVFLSGQASKDI